MYFFTKGAKEKREAESIAALERGVRERKKARRDELLRVAATVQVNPDDVVGYIKERHASEGDKLSRDQLHMLYNAIAAELAVNRAKALISEVDKSP